MAVILGVDPGLASTGYGIIREAGGRLECLDFGVIKTSAHASSGERLETIYSVLSDLLRTHRPDYAGIEGLYFTKNVTSAIPVAQARGVVLLALAQFRLDAQEYTPQQIKQAVVGNGQADKEQVIQMVRVILGLKAPPRPDHAADALAAAVTRLHSCFGR
ncbi:Holliday junction endonuclease RuvC [Alkalispirochaeta americana]|uniref:Crossover junction endodeoxyribonuclease RuvC n=1 Tax=Alkalispirochaeta americana TaxID=159291 RepID=A0A1N6P9E9_9SPIO|nr:crossover junction endodeoxyribonuclease RuvC [Alkalispirochaeta americana]SIQ01000.1 Holliday junction endonuclease RuvC [Alkalispirochaeta americana]